jgi:hypothetical protein
MDMPANCRSCGFSDDEARFCKAAKEYIPMLGKPGFCPLAELPSGHGRLIEADSLKETLDYYIREAGWDEKTNRVLGWVKDEFIDGERTVVESEGDG